VKRKCCKRAVAIDGSEFKVVNTRDKNFTRTKMERRVAQIEESVPQYPVSSRLFGTTILIR